MEERWKEVKVGDIILLKNDEFIAVSTVLVPAITCNFVMRNKEN